MGFEEPKFGGKQKEETEGISEKERAWQEKEKEVEEWADAEGKGVDEGIKETIVGLNLLEFPTSASCEGHLDQGIPVPWVEISAPDKPEERFEGEKKIFERIAKKHKLPVEEVKRGLHQDAYWEAQKEAIQNEETSEYKKWQEENRKLMRRMSQLLEEFYKDREVPPDIRLQIDEQAEGAFRVHNGGEDYQPIVEEKGLSDEEKDKLASKLTEYREEMDVFTQFLKDKYFEK